MSSSLKFGTSGLRGLAVELEGPAARRYVTAFVAHLRATGQTGSGKLFIGRDLRPSSPQIARDCAAAVTAAGLEAIDCGVLPTPALALAAMAEDGAAIMVTGSHIPGDRNGLKFYTPKGEITKLDEQGIAAALGADAPDGAGVARDGVASALELYEARYRGLLAADALSGWRIGVFEHSSVARELLVAVLAQTGADVVRLGRSDSFVAVDTEVPTDAVYAPVAGWIRDEHLDAVVSTDGDADRPLVIDADGSFVRGDVLGLITARWLGADVVVTPVTSNSAIEDVGLFRDVLRTRVGSPYVIAGMETAAAEGPVVGFEANGGVLLGSAARIGAKGLSALPTRDALLPILAVLASAQAEGRSIAELVGTLPVRAALSDRLAEVPQQKSAAFLARLRDEAGFAEGFFAPVGEIAQRSDIDGLRFALVSGDTVHYRPSGNAPEMRCYVEGVTPERAAELMAWGLESAAAQVR